MEEYINLGINTFLLPLKKFSVEYSKYYSLAEIKKVREKHPKIELLGYSPNWAGIKEEDIEKTFKNEYRVMPKDKCYLVDLVRFYIPDKNLIIPCNCAAHRIHQIETEYTKETDIYSKANIMADWLKDNGYNHCSGCEPLNAYLAENPKILKKGLFKY